MKHTTSWLLILTSIALLQVHSVKFWTSHTGTIGYLWSFGLEYMAFWLWWNKRKLLGVLAQLLLVTAPLYQLSLPLFEELRQTNVTSQLLALEQKAIQRGEVILKGMDKSWAGLVDRNARKMEQSEQRTRKLLRSQIRSKDPWQNVLVLVMQALGFILLSITQALAISHISQSKNNLSQERKNVPKTVPIRENPRETPYNALSLYEELEALNTKNKESWRETCLKVDIPQSNISRLKKRINGEKDGASDTMLKSIYVKLKSLEG